MGGHIMINILCSHILDGSPDEDIDIKLYYIYYQIYYFGEIIKILKTSILGIMNTNTLVWCLQVIPFNNI